MSFAQRKFMGFRCKYEYDTKAIGIYTDKQIVVLSYTLESLGESTLDHLVDRVKRNKTSLNPYEQTYKDTNDYQEYDQNLQQQQQDQEEWNFEPPTQNLNSNQAPTQKSPSSSD